MMKSFVDTHEHTTPKKNVCQWYDLSFRSKRKLKAHISGAHQDKLVASRANDDDVTNDKDNDLNQVSKIFWQELGDSLDYYDDELFLVVQELMDSWTKERCQEVNPKTLRKLRQRLHRRGVYTGVHDDLTALLSLSKIPYLEEEEYKLPEWPAKEFMAATFSSESRAYKKQKLLLEKKLQQNKPVTMPSTQKPFTQKPPWATHQKPPWATHQ